MKRDSNPEPRPVMIITDQPIISEIETDFQFSAASNLELLKDLASVGIPQSIIHDNEGRKKIEKIIYTSYLFYHRPKPTIAANFVRKKSLIPENEVYIEVLFHKNLWIKEELWLEFQELLEEIRKGKPKIIITTGKWVFFFLQGYYSYGKTAGNEKEKNVFGGLTAHRASITKLYPSWKLPEIILFPLLPVTEKFRIVNNRKVLTEKAQTIMKWDVQKLGEIYEKVYKQQVPTSEFLNPKKELTLGLNLDIIFNWFVKLQQKLNSLSYNQTLNLSVDIETRLGFLDCIGLGWEKDKALCIPIATLNNPCPWKEEQELIITILLARVLTHPKVSIVGQNFSYDAQYEDKFYLLKLKTGFDTMIGFNVLFNTLSKKLEMLASIYCDAYTSWKGMAKFEKEGEGK